MSVSEQASRFDPFDPALAGPEFWDAVETLRRIGPLCWIENDGGYWMATGYDTVLQMAQDWETFSSARGVAINRPTPAVMPYIMPIDIDPPRQRIYRNRVNPHLTTKALADLEEPIRAITDELIDAFVATGSCDIAVVFTRRLPGTVLFRLLFQCTDDDFRAVEPWARVLSFEPARVAEAAGHLRAWAGGMLAARTAVPDADDVVDAIMHLRDSGEAFADHELLSGIMILIQGGIGTAGNAIGTVVRVLADDQTLQARVRDDHALIPALIEECLRIEPPTPLLLRTITRDVDVAGHHLTAGDRVGLFFGAANRDPGVFDRPNEVDIDRPHNRHLAFGAGPHRCIGSNLARLQIRVAMEQLLTRLGPFRVPPGGRIQYAAGQTRGMASLPLEFDVRAGAAIR